jgi:hypothetical protein
MRVARLDRHGKELGRIRTEPYQGSYGDFRLANLDGEGGPDMLIAGVWSEAVNAMDANGKALWSYVQSHGVDEIWAHDLDGDGRDEVIVGYNARGGIQVLNPDGTLRWKSTIIGNVWSVTAAPLGPEGELWVFGPGRGSGLLQGFTTEGKAHKPIDLRLAGAAEGGRRSGTRIAQFEVYWVRPGRLEGEPVLLVSDLPAAKLACVGRGGKVLWQRSLVVEVQGSRDAMAAPDRPWFALAMNDGRIFIHDIQSGERLLSFKSTHARKLAWVAAAGDAPPLLIVDGHNTVTAYAVHGSGPAIREPLPAAAFEGLPPPDPAKGEPIAWFRARYLYADDLEGKELRSVIVMPLVQEFVQEHGLEPTDEQIRSYKRWYASVAPGNAPKGAEADAMEDQMAHAMVQQWLLNKALHERYGGPVVFQQASPMEAVGAIRRFLEEHQTKGTFRIFDPERQEAFWSGFEASPAFTIPEKEVDFSKPWWEQWGKRR